MKAPAIRPSSCPVNSNVAIVNLLKYSHNVSPSFFLQPMIECESPLYLCNCMKFDRKMYFS